MKLIRFGNPEAEKPGIIDEQGNMLDVSKYIADYNEAFWNNGGIKLLQSIVEKHQTELPIVDKNTRIGAPISRPSKIICIGLNFSDHAAESGMEIPKEPVVFFKATSAYVGPNDDLIIPKGGDKTDWEVELGVVISKKASYVSEQDAEDYIAGYVLHNDYSERAFQLERAGQWVKGKSCDTFAPVGPWLATKDEIDNVDNLNMWLTVNGEIKQKGNTDKLIFKVPFIVHYLSQFMTLFPGDIISTGTPPGVGLGFNPPQYIKLGDIIELGIDGLGSSRQVAKAHS